MTPEEIEQFLPEYLADLIGAVCDKARNQALEEAAKVAEKRAAPNRMLERLPDDTAMAIIDTANGIAGDIRALKVESKQDPHNS